MGALALKAAFGGGGGGGSFLEAGDIRADGLKHYGGGKVRAMSWVRKIASSKEGEVKNASSIKAEAVWGVPKAGGVEQFPIGSCAFVPNLAKKF